MKKLSTHEIRESFLQYFAEVGHTIVPSSSLVPDNDPTLLFTNAGMVQFKNVFLGLEQRPYQAATTTQRCVRAGGKHNDLENVGYTARHHTFFEMLGNFSFGAYFKKEAIQFAWRLLTQVFEIPHEKLWVTVFEEDQESEAIWIEEIGVDPKRLSRCGTKDNFWAMGDTGPCGPCTEIFYDHGPEVAGGPPGSPEADGDRYIEIWNLVFMQFNRHVDGQLTPLPKPCVDTGMGIERIAAVLQGVHNNYDIDLFQHLLKALGQLIHCENLKAQSMRVIVDHIRSVSFLIVDGVTPSNEGRGYVLRRIIRRAVRHGHKLGQTQPFFSQLVPALVAVMGNAYPELKARQTFIMDTILREEEQFALTLHNGLKILDQAIADCHNAVLPGPVIFKLYDTFGFPPDLTADILREKNIAMDMAGFEACMQQQRNQSKKASQFKIDYSTLPELGSATEFLGYTGLGAEGKIIDLYNTTGKVSQLNHEEEGIIVLDRSPFYAESGGQVGDTGLLQVGNARFRVSDTQKRGHTILHFGKMESGRFAIDDQVQAQVNETRLDTARNHSATHLLQAALQKILGKQVEQRGSSVAPDRLRFDYAYDQTVSFETVQAIEKTVNDFIRANVPVKTEILSTEAAKSQGVTMLFGEKYGSTVRVLTMGDFSVEACGGTHVERTGDIGLFRILSNASAAAGVRRIEAVTGSYALEALLERDRYYYEIAQQLKVGVLKVPERLSAVLQELQALQKEVKQLKDSLAEQGAGDLLALAKEVAEVRVLVQYVEGADRETLRQWVDLAKSSFEKVVVLLATVQDNKVQLIVGVSPGLTQQIKAPDVLNAAAQVLGGKGGGRPDMAQGSGENVAALEAALKKTEQYIENILG